VTRPTLTVDGVEHPIAGAQVALIRDGRVLLQFRPWPPGWELPGGHSDDGEDPALTAAREGEEETGHTVRVLRLSGVYTWAGLRNSSDAVYVGEVTGGAWRRSVEALSHRWVTLDELPATTFPWITQRVADALASTPTTPPVHRTQPVSARHMLFFGARWVGFLVDLLRRITRRRSAR
jgi:8-oxo-dGTP pyrophosphatase MutT (NUDIX family)